MKDLGNTLSRQPIIVPMRPGARVAAIPCPSLAPGRHAQAHQCTRAIWRRRAGAAVPLLLAIVTAVAFA